MYIRCFENYLELFEPRESYVSELRLQCAWKNGLWKRSYKSHRGQPIRVICPGRHNFSDGPDFLDARVFIGDRLYAGDIEIHHYTADWYAHGHHKNPGYKDCVLHVVFHPPLDDMKVRCQHGRAIPLCYIPLEEVLNMPAKNSCKVFYADPEPYFRILKDCGWRRIREKIRYFYDRQARFPGDVMLYWGIFKACGYRYNEENMIRLFMSFPWERFCGGQLKSHQLPELLREPAGFGVDKNSAPGIRWTRARTRPAQFPERRIEWLTKLLQKYNGVEISEKLYKMLEKENNWKTVFSKFFRVSAEESAGRTYIGSPGAGMQKEIVLNTILPLMEAMRLQKKGGDRLKEKIYDNISRSCLPQSYGLVKKFHSRHGIDRKDRRSKNWLSAQGVLYIRDHYCSQDMQSCCPICGMGNKNGKNE